MTKKKAPAKKKSAVVRKSRVEKTRNHGTMSEAAFFTWIREKLRRASMYWKPIAAVKKAAQVPYKGDNKRRKFSYVCSECKGEFSDKEVVVHHTIPCGSLKSFEDIAGFAERLFVEAHGLQLICKKCHDIIHTKDI